MMKEHERSFTFDGRFRREKDVDAMHAFAHCHEIDRGMGLSCFKGCRAELALPVLLSPGERYA
jgi:hypothetical protein